MKVGLWCLAVGWALYLAVLLLIYYVFIPTFTFQNAAGAFASDDRMIALAVSALQRGREDPAGFAPRAGPDGKFVKRFPDKPDEAEVDFKSVQADLRTIDVTLVRSGADVKCRVVVH